MSEQHLATRIIFLLVKTLCLYGLWNPTLSRFSFFTGLSSSAPSSTLHKLKWPWAPSSLLYLLHSFPRYEYRQSHGFIHYLYLSHPQFKSLAWIILTFWICRLIYPSAYWLTSLFEGLAGNLMCPKHVHFFLCWPKPVPLNFPPYLRMEPPFTQLHMPKTLWLPLILFSHTSYPIYLQTSLFYLKNKKIIINS